MCVVILGSISATTDYLPFFLIISLSLSIGKGRRYQGEEKLSGRTNGKLAALSSYFLPSSNCSLCLLDMVGCHSYRQS